MWELFGLFAFDASVPLLEAADSAHGQNFGPRKLPRETGLAGVPLSPLVPSYWTPVADLGE